MRIIGRMDKILISACLLGDKTKYDGGDNYFPFVEKLKKKYVLIPFCPELEGGLSVPRSPSEIQKDGSVLNKEGKDVSSFFIAGAEKAYQACRLFGISIAILKDGSPSCGSRHVYDGSFKGNKIDGLGLTARRLIAAGIKVYSSEDKLDFLLGEDEESYEKRKQENIKKAALRKEKGNSYEKKPSSFHKKGGDEGKASFDKKRVFNKGKGFSHKKKDAFHGSPYKKDGEKPYKKDGYHGQKKSSWKQKSKPGRNYKNSKSGYRNNFSKRKPYGNKKG